MIGLGKLRPNKAPDKKRSAPPNSGMGPTPRPRGRPRKLPPSSMSDLRSPSLSIPEEEFSKSTIPQLPKRPKHRKARKDSKLSSFEQLPLELLEKIFVKSMNPCLPHCSRHLLTQFSRDILKYEITMNTLCRHRQELSNAQRGKLLACRFFTWPFIVKYTQWAHKQGVPIHDLDTYQSLSTSQDYSLELYEDRLERHLENLRDEHGRLCFNRIVFGEQYPRVDKTFPHLAGLESIAIPEKILHGPWDDNAICFLRLLILSLCTLDSLGTLAGEVARRGALDAIRDGEDEILTYLFQAQSIRVVPDTEMLRAAVVESDCRLSTVYQILTGFDTTADVDLMDPPIWTWISDATASGDERGPRLKRMIVAKDKGRLNVTGDEDEEGTSDYEDLWSRYRNSSSSR